MRSRHSKPSGWSRALHRGGMSCCALLALMVGTFGACQDSAPPLEPVRDLLSGHEEAGSLSLPSLSLSDFPTYTQLEDGSVAGTPGSLKLEIEAGGLIPRHPDAFIKSVPVFGYGWVDGSSGLGIVAVIHPLIGRDSKQNPDGWHTHPVQLSGGSAFAFCIESIGRSQGGIAIEGSRLRLNIAGRWAGLSTTDLSVAAAFVVRPDAGCATTGLAVDVIDAETLP